MHAYASKNESQYYQNRQRGINENSCNSAFLAQQASGPRMEIEDDIIGDMKSDG